MEIKKEFGNRLKHLRENANITQSELAEKLNLSSGSAIANYEKGLSIPNDDIKIKIAELFNVTTDYLLGKDTSELDNVLFAFYGEKLDGLTKEDIDDVKKLIEIRKELRKGRK